MRLGFLFTQKSTLLIGFFFWLSIIAVQWPFTPFQLTYVEILILAAVLWLLPFIWQNTEGFTGHIHKVALPSALAFAWSFLLSSGQWAAILSLPWLLLTVYLAIQAFGMYLSEKSPGRSEFCRLAAFVYLPVGAIWAIFDRLDVQPFGFDSTIVLLTVAHFHYAGFVLPWLCSCLLKYFPSPWVWRFSLGILMGIPLVALGIITTQFHWPLWLESLFVSIMALSAMGIAGLHLVIGWKYRRHWWAWCWMLGGTALGIGMSLALLYGWRHYFPIPMINIPFMYALHGSLNALGFALPASLAWHFFKSSPH